MPQLRQLHLQLAFEAARPLSEDVENETVAVEHAPTRELLEVAFLAWRERMIHQDHVRIVRGGQVAQLLGLAAAEEIAGIRPLTATGEQGDRQGSGGDRQLPEFLKILG